MNVERLEFFKNLFYSLLRETAENEGLDITTTNASDDVDKALEDRDNLLILKLQGRQTFYVKKISDALGRIHNGTFGLCEECGCDIENARLLARPMTTLCIGCKEEEEKVEGQIPYHRRSHTLGKTLSTAGETNNTVKINSDDVNKERLVDREQKNLTSGNHDYLM